MEVENNYNKFPQSSNKYNSNELRLLYNVPKIKLIDKNSKLLTTNQDNIVKTQPSNYNNLPKIQKFPLIVNNFVKINNKHNTASRNVNSFNIVSNSFNNSSKENVKKLLKQKNYHLKQLKDLIRIKTIKNQTINYYSNKNNNKNGSKLSLNNLIDNNDIIFDTEFNTTRTINKLNNDDDTMALPAIDNFLQSHLVTTPRKDKLEEIKKSIKKINLQKLIKGQKSNISKSIDDKKIMINIKKLK